MKQFMKEAIKEAFETGSGSIQLNARTELVMGKTINTLVIHEIPFGVVKKKLVFEMDSIRANKEIDGIMKKRYEFSHENSYLYLGFSLESQ